MSQDTLRTSLISRDWLVEGPLCDFVPIYLRDLRAQRYSERRIHVYLISLAHFNYWMKTNGLDLDDFGSKLIERYLQFHLPTCNCLPLRKDRVPDSHAALRHLLNLVTQKHPCCLVAPTPALMPIEAELERFSHHLLNICGLATTTCCYRLNYIHKFLKSYHCKGITQVVLPTRQNVTRFINEVAQHWAPSSIGVIHSSLRSYFRFRALAGDQTKALIVALPKIADWTHATLPKALTESQLDGFLKAFNHDDPTGQRDYAIARCLVDLGLRGHEVAHLQLASVDWRNGTLMIDNSKGKRIHHLPLPAQTGEAIAHYLRNGRPQTVNRALFVRHIAPFDKPLGVGAFRSAMNRAFARCGLDDQFCNTHVFRHTVAVRLQQSGASLKEIADVLRHRNLKTTAIYARVDLDGLRAMAMPWPGSQS